MLKFVLFEYKFLTMHQLFKNYMHIWFRQLLDYTGHKLNWRSFSCKDFGKLVTSQNDCIVCAINIFLHLVTLENLKLIIITNMCINYSFATSKECSFYI